MSLIRPEVAARLIRWREPLCAAALALLGLWIATRGGWLLAPLGAGVVALGAGWAAMAVRRLRFAPEVAAPGMVEVDEGLVGYLGPAFGGFVALPDLVELRLLTMQGRRLWRLKQADGQALLIPVDAVGAERLYDAFASLPGMDTAALVAALAPAPPGGGAAYPADSIATVIWRRSGRGIVTR